jgi:hypothetical protein
MKCTICGNEDCQNCAKKKSMIRALSVVLSDFEQKLKNIYNEPDKVFGVPRRLYKLSNLEFLAMLKDVNEKSCKYCLAFPDRGEVCTSCYYKLQFIDVLNFYKFNIQLDSKLVALSKEEFIEAIKAHFTCELCSAECTSNICSACVNKQAMVKALSYCDERFSDKLLFKFGEPRIPTELFKLKPSQFIEKLKEVYNEM